MISLKLFLKNPWHSSSLSDFGKRARDWVFVATARTPQARRSAATLGQIFRRCLRVNARRFSKTTTCGHSTPLRGSVAFSSLCGCQFESRRQKL